MSARAKHSRDSEVREKKKKSNFLNFFFVMNLEAALFFLLQRWSGAMCGSMNQGS